MEIRITIPEKNPANRKKENLLSEIYRRMSEKEKEEAFKKLCIDKVAKDIREKIYVRDEVNYRYGTFSKRGIYDLSRLDAKAWVEGNTTFDGSLSYEDNLLLHVCKMAGIRPKKKTLTLIVA